MTYLNQFRKKAVERKLQIYLLKFLGTTEEVYISPVHKEVRYDDYEEQLPMAAEPILPPEED